jgi:MerR family transcriptional regulator, light-induced transcriptional regulator
MEEKRVHPIRVAERRAGVSSHLIRKWEQRYRAVEPGRTETGRRLYSDADIERLSLLQRAVRNGRSIGQVANLSDEELTALIEADSAAVHRLSRYEETEAPGTGSHAKYIRSVSDRFVQRTAEFDDYGLETLLHEALSRLGQQTVIDELIPSLMHRLGDEWQRGNMRIVHEHLATFVVEGFLNSLYYAVTLPASAPFAVSATFKEQVHTVGVLSAALVGRSAGWQTIYLGGNTPVEETAGTAVSLNARVVLLSLNYPYTAAAVVRELRKLRLALPHDIQIIAGGPAASSLLASGQSEGVTVLGNFTQLRLHLTNLLKQISYT